MAEPYFGVVANFYIFGRHVQISTPNWNVDPEHQPRWFPKWEYVDIDIPCNQSKMFMFDWFFHLTVIWGGPTKPLLNLYSEAGTDYPLDELPH